ncbi:MAG: right-handed parallel beta-helix repeat-containing protein [Myxococcota bacterium]
MRSLLLILPVALAVAGCGGGRRSGTPQDGGMDADANPTPRSVNIPWLAAGQPPMTPSERTCPAGWQTVQSDTGVIVCDPWPEGTAQDCTGPSAHFPGEPGCRTIGSPCPPGTFPEGLPTDRPIVYVDDDAPFGGDGTRARPFQDPGFAVSRAPPNAIVAIGKGTYDTRVELFSDVTVWGACPAETRLTSSMVSETNTVAGAFLGGSVGIRNLTIGAPSSFGLFLTGGSTVDVRDIVIDQAWGFGIYVTDPGTSATIENVIVRNVAPLGSGFAGFGIQVVDDGRATIRRTVLEDNSEGHLVVASRAEATIENVSGRRAPGSLGMERSGLGLTVQDSATATIRALVLEENEAGGMIVVQGSSATVTNFFTRNLGSPERTIAAAAVEVRVDSILDLSGLHVVAAQGAAVIGGENGVLTLHDAVIEDMAPTNGGGSGRGISPEGTASFTVERALLERCRRTAVVTRPGTELRLTDVTIRETIPDGARDLGLGLALFGNTHRLERVVIDGSVVEGMALSGPEARAELIDVVVRESRSDSLSGFLGRGIEVNLGAELTGERVLLERNREVGLFVIDADTEVALRDMVIRDTLGEDCGDECPAGAFGYGVAVLREASLDLEGFRITRSRLVGVQVSINGTVRAAQGEIAECEIGLNVQDAAVDVDTDLTEVEFREVDRNLDVAMLPVPEALNSSDL